MSLALNVPVVAKKGVVVIASATATNVGKTVKVIVVLEHGGELILHKV